MSAVAPTLQLQTKASSPDLVIAFRWAYLDNTQLSVEGQLTNECAESFSQVAFTTNEVDDDFSSVGESTYFF